MRALSFPSGLKSKEPEFIFQLGTTWEQNQSNSNENRVLRHKKRQDESTTCPTRRVAEPSLRTPCAIRPRLADRPSFLPPPFHRCTALQSPAPWTFVASPCPPCSV